LAAGGGRLSQRPCVRNFKSHIAAPWSGEQVSPGIRFNEHLGGDGPTVFAHACKLGLEGIVSKRKDSAYRSGRSPDWLKMKNPACSAVKREAEEDWGAGRWQLPDVPSGTFTAPRVFALMEILPSPW